MINTEKQINIRLTLPHTTNHKFKLEALQNHQTKIEFIEQLLSDYAEGKLEYKQEAKPVNLPLQFK